MLLSLGYPTSYQDSQNMKRQGVNITWFHNYFELEEDI